MPGTVLVTDHVFGNLDLERESLAAIGFSLQLSPAADEDTLTEHAEHAQALLVCYAPVTARVLQAAARGGSRIAARYGIGVDNVDLAAASEAGILVTNVPDYCLDEVADHTLMLMLAALRNLHPAALAVDRGEWTVPQSGIHRLRGRRLALVGVGRIGRRVAERALAFGLEVVGYDPYLSDWSQPPGLKRAASLREAIAEADIISLHAPLTVDNHHLIDDEAIAIMTRAPLVVNTSRGGLVDLEAVTRALQEGRLSAVALDVTEPEPLPAEHPLRAHPRALVTPHMSFYSAEAQQDLQRRAVEEVVRALTGQSPRCPVNPEVLEQARG